MSSMPGEDVQWEPWLSLGRMVLWWGLCLAGVAVGVRYRNSSSGGWLLYKLINLVVLFQAVMMTLRSAYEVSWVSIGDGSMTDALYMAFIPLNQLATSSFQGLLLLLASGYCITRRDMGPHKPFVVGIPLVILVTGTITDFIYFRVTRITASDTNFFDLEGWEATLWFFCTLLNICALVMSWVYTFDILQQETDALMAQEQANLQRMQAEADSFPSHAAPPPVVDPLMEPEGGAYKNLLGAGHTMSHVAGADVEAQEFETVADRVNFEIKKKMYARFSMGVAAYLTARVCVLLLPVFYLNILQTIIVFLDFLVQLGFLGTLLYMFRPAEDSPYLMIGGSAEDTAALGMSDLGTALEVDPDDVEGQNGVPPAVELAPAGIDRRKQEYRAAAAAAAGNGAGSGSERPSRDQDPRRPAVNGMVAAPAPAGAAAAAAAAHQLPVSRSVQEVADTDAGSQARLAPIRPGGAHFSLGDEDDMMEVQLHSSPRGAAAQRSKQH